MIAQEIFETNDLVLKNLELPNPCPIKIILTDNRIKLFVGQIDWEWDIATREFVAAGTNLYSQTEKENIK